MKTIAWALVASLSCAPLAVDAQTMPMMPQPFQEAATLAVVGNATVRREPDEARVDVTIVTSDANPTRSAGMNTAILDTLEAKLAPLGVVGDAIGTTSFNVSYQPPPANGVPPQDRPARTGYITTRDLVLRVDAIGRVGKVVDASTAAGVTHIDGVRFGLKDRAATYREALVAALADARATATALAASGGFRLAHIRRIDAGGGAPRPIGPIPNFARIAVTSAAAPPPTEIAPNGPIEVSAHVDVTYDIR